MEKGPPLRAAGARRFRPKELYHFGGGPLMSDEPRRTLRIVGLRDPGQNQSADEGADQTTAAERVEMMWQLALDAWAFMGEPVVEQRLPRHIVHIDRRER